MNFLENSWDPFYFETDPDHEYSFLLIELKTNAQKCSFFPIFFKKHFFKYVKMSFP